MIDGFGPSGSADVLTTRISLPPWMYVVNGSFGNEAYPTCGAGAFCPALLPSMPGASSTYVDRYQMFVGTLLPRWQV